MFLIGTLFQKASCNVLCVFKAPIPRRHLVRFFGSRHGRCGHDGRFLMHCRRLCLLSANIRGVSCVPPVPFEIEPNRNLRRVSFVYALEFVVAHWNHVGNGSRCLVGLCTFRHCQTDMKCVHVYIHTGIQTLQLQSWQLFADHGVCTRKWSL